MILSNIVKLKINNRQVKHYKEKGYDIKGGDEINVNVVDLTTKSNALVDVCCDKCGKEKKIMYRDYNRFTRNQTEPYYCNQCNDIKRKITNQEIYGTNNVFQSEKIKEKRKKTMVEKYGDEHALNVDIFKEKMKNTNRERFGTDYASQNEDIKKKIENTFMINYGVKTSLLDAETIEKIKKTNLNLYGVENVFELESFRKDNLIERYGVEYPVQSEIIKERIRQTCLERYGVCNAMENEEIINKMIRTKQESGFYLINDKRSDFENYRLKVKRLTKKFKKILFENWDGYDYYDGEYIKNNFSLGSSNKNYPSIDHKISTFYGFINNISPEIISDISNLCITKMVNNSSKGAKNTI